MSHIQGVAEVWPNIRYHALRDAGGPEQIGADKLWGQNFETAGNGMKIGIIDDGLDATHTYFDPNGFQYPPGFPKGMTKYTTPKVIVQRVFTPASPTSKYSKLPFDPVNSFHATHVAGIAAGDHGAAAAGNIISGVAPNAYLGNYKALTIPTPGFGLDGNSAEIAAAIEAAVSDGMNVINLSLGEPEVEPSRDIVVKAIEGAAAAGVVPVVAAGNDFGDFGYGSVSSPGNAPDAITVAAVSSRDVIADFSSAGPTPTSLEMKPDVSAPGVNVLSSLPVGQGTWGLLSGTSMATPHVAGAAALLKERHPDWTVAELKSALEQTGDPVKSPSGAEVLSTREGGGLIDLAKADVPLLFASPTGLSFGRLAPGQSATRDVTLTDAGGGAGDWTVTTVVQQGSATPVVPAQATVPGLFSVAITVPAGATPGDETGFVVLTRGADVRRIPFWFAVSAPKLAGEAKIALKKPGTYRGTTAGGPSLITSYRYPTAGDATYPGPERAYRVAITGHPANFGVVVTSGHVTPHVTFDGAEDHLVGYPGLPIDLNPYRQTYGSGVPVAGGGPPRRRVLRRRLRHAQQRGCRCVLLPVLGERHHAAHIACRSDEGSDHGLGDGRRIGRRPGVDRRDGRRQDRASDLFVGNDSDPGGQGQACPRPERGRLPGDEEHGRRPADPAEHPQAPRDRARSLVALCARIERRQIREVALDGPRELVRIVVGGVDHPQVRALAGPRAVFQPGAL